MNEQFRLLPAVHKIQDDNRFKTLIDKSNYTHNGMTKIVQEILDETRERILQGLHQQCDTKDEMMDQLFHLLQKRLNKDGSYRLRSVINATGVVIHTNLGRSRLSEAALNQMIKVAKHYSNLEYNIEKGVRGSRHDLVEDAVKELTVAEAAMIVNNNAAAVYIVLRAFTQGKGVVVSRGELVEIGGSFRISSIMEESGATLKEVGTTNKTHLYDYENAIDETTGMLMKVHTSNFKVVGFTDSVSTEELVKLSRQHEGVLTYEDLGSGALHDFQHKGIGDEPLVRKVIETGVDLVTFSGDKLLGGPQCGIIAGKAALIHRLKMHQMARVLRVDKFTLAALEATLHSYKYDQYEDIPTVRDILRPLEEIKAQSVRFIERASKSKHLTFELQEGYSKVGGGTMPEVELPTYNVCVKHESMGSEELFNTLRATETPIIGRIKDEQLILDLRTVTSEEESIILKTFESICV
ncbi:L-seryl-tRNA(Sec) selenium transferase [Pseudalkalibacillus berkeleyi]|uniref:L-seryl-tRNA(Sec) selenium transferase n=1 Tax=Pseudalkalibacillus berkeleyi TaxID=1069813 RepID=A0ABS9GZW4_9BACL|nr:L-seryl-tRNA(Sec) selenium transferase [Pseudalkalibacillus berkeleyi]MCF6137235.1 L-seryl-tRNA(Sec) selenium transferase [Pseudalkalibacillus berkeleyi]